MHPAFSVIAFTVSSGFGYGLLFWLGVATPFRLLPDEGAFGLTAVASALVLITAGLLASMLHLGRPERAWRAFSQWRSSWLSREGIASVITYVPAALLGLGWVLRGPDDPGTIAAGVAEAACSAATVFATGMIYASLKPIPQWNSGTTVPGYLLLAAMSGATLLGALCLLFGRASTAMTASAVLLTAAGWLLKTLTWRASEERSIPATLNSATGLAGGTVRSVEWPHTEENYLLKEMGYRVGRKHARKLRGMAHGLAFAIPLALSLLVLVASQPVATAAAILAVAAQAIGLFIERWLFFAEATHTVTLYYGPRPD